VLGLPPIARQRPLRARAHRSGAKLHRDRGFGRGPQAEGADHMVLFDEPRLAGLLPEPDGRESRLRSRWPPQRHAGGTMREAPRRDRTRLAATPNMLQRKVTVDERRSSRVLHRNLRETPRRRSAGGIWLIAEDGRRVLDAQGRQRFLPRAPASANYRREASRRRKLVYSHTSFFSSEPAEALADHLVGDEPGGLAYAYFVSGGSEAIEASIKLARQYFVERGELQRQRLSRAARAITATR